MFFNGSLVDEPNINIQEDQLNPNQQDNRAIDIQKNTNVGINLEKIDPKITDNQVKDKGSTSNEKPDESKKTADQKKEDEPKKDEETKPEDKNKDKDNKKQVNFSFTKLLENIFVRLPAKIGKEIFDFFSNPINYIQRRSYQFSKFALKQYAYSSRNEVLWKDFFGMYLNKEEMKKAIQDAEEKDELITKLGPQAIPLLILSLEPFFTIINLLIGAKELYIWLDKYLQSS